MKKALNLSHIISLASVTVFAVLMLIDPTTAKRGSFTGLLLCGRVIIPSLFPFTVCVLFILRSGALKILNPLSRITYKLFGLSASLFAVFILSCLGGYPVGAKLLEEMVRNNELSPKKASAMLNFCINAGPAFIVSAVGVGIIGSKMLGNVLLVSHLTASLILCLSSRFFVKDKPQPPKKSNALNPTDNFTLSVADASSTVLSICGFVLLFSCLVSFVMLWAEKYPLLKTVVYFLEVTNGITFTNNLYLISFLLGLAGLSIWCQIISVCKKIKINLWLFLIYRFLHGALSAAFTKLLVEIFNITVPTLQSSKAFTFSAVYSTPALSISMLVMAIVFLISVSTKKYAGKILEDMV